MKRRTLVAWAAALASLISMLGGSLPSYGATPGQNQIGSSAVSIPGTAPSGKSGWIGSVSASYGQNKPATLTLPLAFLRADLLVATVANDGPDSNTSETTAVFGGTPGLTWIRHAHVSARQDLAAPGDRRDARGASSGEIWTAVPPPAWVPGIVTEISNHPNSTDDGGVITVAAWANGQFGQAVTLDGLNRRPEHQNMLLSGAGSSIYAVLFNGRRNAKFTPVSGYHTVVTRRAGDDTAQVIASTSRDLRAGWQTIGYTSRPSAGDYWEEAIAVVRPAH